MCDIPVCWCFVSATLFHFPDFSFIFLKICIHSWSLYSAEVLKPAFCQDLEYTKKSHWPSTPRPPPPLLGVQDPSSAQPGAISPCPRDATGVSCPIPCFFWIAVWLSQLTLDLTCHLAIARLLSCQQDVSPSLHLLAQPWCWGTASHCCSHWCHTLLVLGTLLALRSPLSAEHSYSRYSSTCTPVPAACTASSQPRQHTSTFMTGWGSHLRSQLLLFLQQLNLLGVRVCCCLTKFLPQFNGKFGNHLLHSAQDATLSTQCSNMKENDVQ